MRHRVGRAKTFFGLANAALYCNLSKRQVRRVVDSGDLHPILIGRSFFFLRSDLDEWKEKRNRIDGGMSPTVET